MSGVDGDISKCVLAKNAGAVRPAARWFRASSAPPLGGPMEWIKSSLGRAGLELPQESAAGRLPSLLVPLPGLEPGRTV
jgi:hypothetical protein